MESLAYKWLLDFCSYYNGEEDCPTDDSHDEMFWFYEKAWVMKISHWEFSLGEINEYIHLGLGPFSEHDGVPQTLKIVLFNRYMHWSCQASPEDFKTWYLKHYRNRLKEKKLSKGKRILNRYRLAFLEYRCNWRDITPTPEMDYMFAIANAVDAEHGFDAPIAESVMCKALAHADTHGYTIELIPDAKYLIRKPCDGWKYHPEFKEIRMRALDFLKNNMPEYDNAEYRGRWNGRYVYAPFCESGEVHVTGMPRYILVDKDSVEDLVDRELKTRGKIRW